MTDLYRALADIDAIRGQMARGTAFRGYGPAILTVTGVLAALAAILQGYFIKWPAREVPEYLAIWITTAAVALFLIALDAVIRARRVHPGLANEMILSAAEPFLPPIAAGSLLTIVLVRSAPQSLWMLPGLWQIVYSLGVFSSCKVLPRPMLAVGVWYLATGLLYLATGGGGWAFSPWAMGVPYGIGQVLVAAVLLSDERESDDKP